MISFPGEEDYIDIHTHDPAHAEGIFAVDVLMAHEQRTPANTPGAAFTFGVHPWHLDEKNHNRLIGLVRQKADDPLIIAIGEAGFDKIKGPSMELQETAFREQAEISEQHGKPLVVHCVRAWDELIREHKKLRPVLPWLVHGFRGSRELASQLINRGMYISFWFGYVLRPESSSLVRSLPRDRFFLETDGADIDIRDIYNKVSRDLQLSVEQLKKIMFTNFSVFFNLG